MRRGRGPKTVRFWGGNAHRSPRLLTAKSNRIAGAETVLCTAERRGRDSEQLQLRVLIEAVTAQRAAGLRRHEEDPLDLRSAKQVSVSEPDVARLPLEEVYRS